MSRNYLVIAHPKTGKKHRLPRVLHELARQIKKRGYRHAVHYTRKNLNGMLLVKQYLQHDHTDILAVGGDGTLNEVINGFEDPNLVFSFIPNGSGNDFAKNFQLGSLERQVERALDGPVQKIDLGICNGRKFINGVGIGLDGQVIFDLLHKKNILSGAGKYYYHVLRNLFSYRSQFMDLHIHGARHQGRVLLLCVANGTTFGNGFRLTPQADIFDGQLDVCQIAPLSVWKRLLHVPKLAKGTHGKLAEVKLYGIKQIRVDGKHLLYAHIDGEYMGTPPFEIEVLPKNLKIRFPE